MAEFQPSEGLRKKGRLFKMQQRSIVRWRRDPVLRCDCGRVETRFDDEPHGLCPYGNCVQFYCTDCGRIRSGFGPMGCLCDSRPSGHQRRAEQPKSGVRRKYRDKRRRPKHWWERRRALVEELADG